MAKIIINYDLIHKVKQANGEMNFSKLSRIAAPYLAIVTVMRFGLNSIIYKDVAQLLIKTGTDVVRFALMMTLGVKLATMSKLGNYSKANAENSLVQLVSKLHHEGRISTSIKHLLNAKKVYRTEYKLVPQEGQKLPDVEQYKYISIKTYNYKGEEQDTTLLQEHIFGTDEWYISIGEPEKKKVLVPSFSSI